MKVKIVPKDGYTVRDICNWLLACDMNVTPKLDHCLADIPSKLALRLEKIAIVEKNE